MKMLSKLNITQSKALGFTIPELLVSLAVISTLILISTISIVNVKQRVSLKTSVDIFIGNMKQQQLRAMVGDTGGREARDDYGIHLTTNSYILFHGNSYADGAAGNYEVQLGDNVEFVAGSDLVFLRPNGDLAGGAMTVTIHEKTTNEQKTIQINRYGVVVSVN